MLPGTVEQNLSEFHGRTWLLPQLCDWLDDPSQRFLLLSGAPGTGKSMLMAWLAGNGPVPRDADSAARLQRLRASVKAAHFCMATSASTITARTCLESIATQLGDTLEGFSTALLTRHGKHIDISVEQQIEKVGPGGRAAGVHIENLHIKQWDDEAALCDLLVEPLKHCLHNGGGDQPVLILIDALDESSTASGRFAIVQMLTRLDDLPDNVRFLVSTRPAPRVLRFFRTSPVISLDDAAENRRDVDEYLRARLAETAGESPPVSAQLIEAANGNFLYAELALRELQQQGDRLRDDALPSDLAGLYEDFLNREVGSDDERWDTLLKPVIGLIAVAQDTGLGQRRLTDILGDDVSAALKALRPYLVGELPDGPLRVFHQSFRDWLLADENNRHYRIDAPRMHARIAEHYLGQLHAGGQLDDYGLNNLVVHLLESERLDDAVALLSESWLALRYRGGTFTDAGFNDDVDRVWQALQLRRAEDATALAHVAAAREAVLQRVHDYADEDLATLVWLGRIDEASAHARLRAELDKVVDSLNVVAQAAIESGTITKPIVDEATLLAAGIERTSLRSDAQLALVKLYLQLEQLDDAGRLARAIDDQSKHAQAAGLVAEALAGFERLDEARELLPRDADAYWPREQYEALCALAVGLARDGQNTALGELTSISRRGRDQGRALRSAVDALAEAGDVSAAGDIATLIADDGERARALAAIAAANPDVNARQGLLEQASSLAVREDSHFHGGRFGAGRSIVRKLIEHGLLDEALTVADRIDNGADRCEALGEVAAALHAGGDERADSCVDSAQNAASSAADALSSANALMVLGRTLLDAGMPAAGAVLHATAAVARDIEHHERRGEVQEETALAMAHAGDTAADTVYAEACDSIAASAQQSREDARQEAENLGRAGERGFYAVNPPHPLRRAPELAIGLVHARRLDAALALVRRIEWISDRVQALYGMARVLNTQGDTRVAGELFDEALAAAEGLQDPQSRTRVLLDWLEELLADNHDRCDEIVEACIAQTEKIEHDGRRAGALRSLARLTARAHHPRAAEIFSHALRAARAHRPGYRRDQVLEHLVGALVSVGEAELATRLASEVAPQELEAAREFAQAMTMIDAGLLDDALLVAAQNLPGTWNVDLRHALSLALARNRRIDEALKVSEGIVYAHYLIHDPSTPIAIFETTGRLDEASDYVEQRLANPYAQIMAWRDLAGLAAADDVDRAKAWFQQAEQLTHAVEHDSDQMRLWSTLSNAAADAGLFEQAQAFAERVAEKLWRGHNLAYIAAAAVKRKDPRAAELIDAAENLARDVLSTYIDGSSPFISLAGSLHDADPVRFDALVREALPVSRRTLPRRNELAESLVGAGRYAEALWAIGGRPLDQFIDRILDWRVALEGRRRGLFLEILGESLSVAAWVDETWARAARVLSAEESQRAR